jgi:hypothetical protein
LGFGFVFNRSQAVPGNALPRRSLYEDGSPCPAKLLIEDGSSAAPKTKTPLSRRSFNEGGSQPNGYTFSSNAPVTQRATKRDFESKTAVSLVYSRIFDDLRRNEGADRFGGRRWQMEDGRWKTACPRIPRFNDSTFLTIQRPSNPRIQQSINPQSNARGAATCG